MARLNATVYFGVDLQLIIYFTRDFEAFVPIVQLMLVENTRTTPCDTQMPFNSSFSWLPPWEAVA